MYSGLDADGPGQRWKDYALRANERGEALIETLAKVKPRLAGRRHLDIGCGYGGVCVAAAKRGAKTVGIDINPGLLELAALNQVDHPGLDLEFRLIDILDRDTPRQLGLFDAITCDNVIEHVRHPEVLIAHIARMLKPGGVVYMSIPNANSVGQVLAECHYELFGASLLDSSDAAEYLRTARGLPRYDVSVYYPYEVYAGFFDKYGLATRLLMGPELTSEAETELRADLAELQPLLAREVGLGRVPDSLVSKLSDLLEAYEERASAVLDEYARARSRGRRRLGGSIRREYVEEVWYLMGSDTPRALRYRPGSLPRRGVSRLKRLFRI
jgi:SAM-dependent methyltransferase